MSTKLTFFLSFFSAFAFFALAQDMQDFQMAKMETKDLVVTGEGEKNISLIFYTIS